MGNAALAQDRLDDAEARFSRMVEIYKRVYGVTHYRLGVAIEPGSVYVARKQYPRAEKLYREAIAIQSAALSPEHLNTGIARIKLGRTLLRQNRWAEATRESFAGYEIVSRQANPIVSFLHNARMDLAAAYDSLGQPGKALKFRAELEDEKRQTASTAKAR